MTDRGVVRTVVTFVGLAVLIFGTATAVLAWRVLDASQGSGTVDAAAVGIVGITAGFTTTALGILGGLLISTRTTPDAGEVREALAPLNDVELPPQPVVVVNPPEAPAMVEDVAP